MRTVLVIGLALLIGLGVGWILFVNDSIPHIKSPLGISLSEKKHEVIGFLPYWLIGNADKDYTKYITTLTYFGLTVSEDGSIRKLVNETEEEPGWTTLRTGKADKLLDAMKKTGGKTSLLVFSADEETIARLMDDPEQHADTMMDEIIPIMKNRKFDDLNLDIESFQLASSESQLKFIQFTKRVKERLDEEKAGTLSIDVSPSALIKPYLADPYRIERYVDQIILMSYDYHYSGSSATGPVAPVGGAGVNEEIDSTIFLEQATQRIPSKKILLGTALYGYEWETLTDRPRTGIVPGSGITASNRRIEEFIKTCEKCVVKRDALSRESYVGYKTDEGVYKQIFYPDSYMIQEKINLAKKFDIGGLALWALGYDGKTILTPLEKYK